MKLGKMVEKSLFNICMVTIAYISMLSVLIIFFTIVYACYGEKGCLQLAVSALFPNTKNTFNCTDMPLINVIMIIETFMYSVLNIIIVAFVLRRGQSPISDIFISDCVVRNSKGKLVFRYWIFRKRGKFLYDVKVDVYLIREGDDRQGINGLKPTWRFRESVSDSECNYSQARGIRYVEIKKKHSKMLMEKLKSDKALVLLIRATDEQGRIYYSSKQYRKEDIFENSSFVPVDDERDTYAYSELKKNIEEFNDKYKDLNYGFNPSFFNSTYKNEKEFKKEYAEKQRNFLKKIYNKFLYAILYYGGVKNDTVK